MKKIIFISTLLIFSFQKFNCFAKEKYENLQKHEFMFLMDYDTKEILLSKNAKTRVAPSSMTKLMTAYVVLDQIEQGKISLDNKCVIGRDAYKKRGSTMFLNYGDIVSIDDLLKGLLAVSGNDASVALAQAVGGSVDKFVALMNFKAKELGLKNSNFRNPHGLNENGHYMSLEDLGILLSRFYQDFPEFESYLSIEKFTYSNITQPNSNPLIKSHYDGVVGGKTGYTNDGGYGVIASVKRGNRRLIAAVNKSRTSSQRTRIIHELFDYGFDNYAKLTLFKKDQTIASLQTWMGQKNQIKVASNQEISVNLPQNIDPNSIEIKVNYQAPLYAPINKGQKVADLQIKIKNYKTLNYSLFATENIEKARFFNKMTQKANYEARKILSKLHNFIFSFQFA